MNNNYRPFSWEEYQKNPELLRTKGDLNNKNPVRRLSKKEGTRSLYPIRGITGGEIHLWKADGTSFLSNNRGKDLILKNPPKDESNKLRLIINNLNTGDITII